MNFMIDDMKESDWQQVSDIYLEGIRTGIATFETDVPNWDDWDAGHLKTGRLVARYGDSVLGWAALTPYSNRCIYAGVAEESIYISPSHKGKGIGKALLSALIKKSEESGFWTLQAGIISDNAISIALHERCGFRIVGIREKIGKSIDGIWTDVVLMERRSEINMSYD
ncbi:MAG: N-acetyltransferase family protein [Eubacteriales bacterium]|nr:N-acetyltransferase family protein [Eubacteriales bacterium]